VFQNKVTWIIRERRLTKSEDGNHYVMQDALAIKVHQYLLAREAAESAAEIVKELESDIKTEMLGENLKRIDHEGSTLLLIQAERRTFDAPTLKDLVSSSVFQTITVVEVRAKMFDAAVAVGMISPEVIEQVITRIPYTQLRVGKNQHGTRKTAS
jgi:hypothetical protein